jgi:hypothetical protein
MIASRAEFYSTLRFMLRLSRDRLLTDTFPPNDAHNIGARILRHGLSVTAFAMLEKYSEGRFSELMAIIGTSRVKYPLFKDRLKRFLTIDAVSGLSNRTHFLDPSDQQAFIDSQIKLLAAYDAAPAVYTALGFSPRGSNVSDIDIKRAFRACGVEAPWEKLSQIATAVGSSRISLSSDYRNLAKTRHSSAHNPTGNVASSDLQTNIDTAIVIGIAIDVLSTAVANAFTRARTPTALDNAIQQITHRFRFIDEQPNGTWMERINGRTVKRYADEIAATTGTLSRSQKASIIARDVRRVPIAMIG